MRSAVGVVLLAACLASANHVGKTDGQILKMGRGAWTEYYQRHGPDVGMPTVSGCHADEIFGRVLRARNDRALSRLSVARRSTVRGVRRQLYSFTFAAMNSSQNAVGVGFLWPVQFRSSIGPDVEQAVWDCLSTAKRGQQQVSPAAIEKVLHEMGLGIQASARDLKAGKQLPSDPPSAGKSLRSARAALGKIVAGCRRLPPHMANSLLGQCLEAAKDCALNMGVGNANDAPPR